MKTNNPTSLFQKDQMRESLKQSFVKLNPRTMIKNPIMFTVEVSTVIMLVVTIYSLFNTSQGSFAYNALVFVILFITLLFANFAEAIAEARGKAQADSLRKTREETPAKIIVGNKTQTVSSSQLKKGDIFVCEAGDTIPADGEIIEGLASIDESAITGESAPVIREAGGDKSSVTGGTKVLSDTIKVLVTQQPGESFLDKMIALVEGASRQKTPNEIALTILLAGFTLVFVIVCITLKPFADYTGTVITIASFISLFVCLIPTTIGGLLSAIGIAGMDRALRANVITKSGKAVETAGDIDTLLLDKTGTITYGKPKQTDLIILSGDAKHTHQVAASLATRSDHPVSLAIASNATESNLLLLEVDKFEAILGRGVRGTIEGNVYQLGNHRLIEELSLCSPEIEGQLLPLEKQGKTVVMLANSSQVLALIAVADTIRDTSKQAIKELHYLGIKTMMLTGDNAYTAEAIGKEVGVDVIEGNLLPEDKLKIIDEELVKNPDGKVGMVGDGINDAPALAKASIGFAMGTAGTDTAIEAADVALMDDDLRKIPSFVRLSQTTANILHQNITLALGIKAIFLALTFTGQATMWMAVFADMGASLLVVANGLRLLRFSK